MGDAFLLSLFGGIVYSNPIVWMDAIPLLIILFLLLCSAFMSSNEVAFFSLTPKEVQQIKEQEHPNDPRLLQLLSHSEQLLATILIGNNAVNVGITILCAWFVGEHWDFSANLVAGFIIQTVLITFLLLLFGEIIPKIYAQRHPLSFIRMTAPAVSGLYKGIAWCSKGLIKTSKLLGSKAKRGPELSVDDLSEAVALTTNGDNKETEMIHEIVKFYHKTADEIMVPRVDMVGINYHWAYHQTLSFAVDTGYSRLPVYDGSQDTIRGVLYVKDLLPHMHEEDTFPWQKIIRQAYFVPENKKIDTLLEELQQERIHMAIVIDEFGGTSGLITLEDILEEIVGEIVDEYDDEDPPYVRLAEGVYLIDGGMSLIDLCKLLDVEPEYFAPHYEEVDTVGGLFLEVLQEIPQVGQQVTISDIDFIVTRMERHRIMQLKMRLHPKEQTDTQTDSQTESQA